MTEGAPAPAQPSDRSHDTDGNYRLALGLLMLVSMFNMMDRQIVNILAEIIRDDLGLSDTQLGLVTGTAFAMLYTLLALPIARLAEVWNRPRIVAASLAFWSAFTMVCGLARNFAELFVARLLVGVGEAGSGPAAFSLVGDIVPPSRRATALAIVAIGAPIGTLGGMALGGLAGEALGWRTALLVAGAPGLLLALVVALAISEPRGARPHGQEVARPNFAATLRDLSGRRSFWWLSSGAAIFSLCSFTFGSFAGSLFLRHHQAALLLIADAVSSVVGAKIGATGILGLLLGLAMGLAATVGMLSGGLLSDVARRRDRGGYLTVSASVAMLACPLFIWSAMADAVWIALSALAVAMSLSAAATPPMLASVQSVVKPESRATSTALLLMMVNLVALGIGPLMVGLISDALSSQMGSVHSLRWALSICALTCPLAALCFLRARRFFSRDSID